MRHQFHYLDVRRISVGHWSLLVALVAAMVVSNNSFVSSRIQTRNERIVVGEFAQASARVGFAQGQAVADDREAVAQSAEFALANAVLARSEAESAAVSPEALAALDHASSQVEELVEQIRTPDRVDGMLDDPASTDRAGLAPAGIVETGAIEPGPIPGQIAPAAVPDTQSMGSVSPEAASNDRFGLAVTTPQTAPDPVADRAVIIDVVPTAVDQAREALPEVETSDVAVASLIAAVDQLAVSTAEVNAEVEETRIAAELQAAAEKAAAEAAAQQVQALAAAERIRAIRMDRDAHSLDRYLNGQIPLSALCSPAFDRTVHLRCDAAEMLDGLNQAYETQFGTELGISDSYRSLENQVICREVKGDLCADPGTSKHGIGLAIDLAGPPVDLDSEEHQWLLDHGPEFGWVKPEWSLPTGAKPESWHFEFKGYPGS